MKQKYSIHKDIEKQALVIKEYGELNKEILSLLCEEAYPEEVIQGAIKGKAIPTASASPCASASVMPLFCIMVAIATINTMLRLEDIMPFTVPSRMLFPAPAWYNPARR